MTLKLAVCTLTGSPTDVHVWSGTPAHFVEALVRRSLQPVLLGPLSPRVYKLANVVAVGSGRMKARVNWEAEPAMLKHFTRVMRRRLRRQPVDIALLMGWCPWGLKPADPPCVYWGDATVGQRLELAPHWSGLSRRTRRAAEDTEAASLRALAGVFMPSDWAREDAISRYALDPSRVFKVPFGANIADPGPIVRTIPDGPLRVLSVGVKWQRKGMDRAVRAVDALNADGVNTRLDVVGAEPPDRSWRREHVVYHGFLSKRNPEHAAELDRLYRDADLFLLPTRNDPSPMVLGEAGAYSLPVVAARVGGVPDRVHSGGILVDEDAADTEYVEAIRRIVDPRRYIEYCRGSRKDFEMRSSWDATAGLVERLANQLLMP